LMNKLDWQLFNNNYDCDLEMSMGIKLSNIGVKIGHIESILLEFVNSSKLDYYNSLNYLTIIKIDAKSNDNKLLHDTFSNLLGALPVSNIPQITFKPEVNKNIKPKLKSRYKFLDKGTYNIDISIVLPTLNGFPHIQTMIKCIEQQSFSNYELIIVNDGSTQSDLLDYFKTLKNNKKINIISLEKNGGLPHALNIGLKHSKGKYWTWVSDDNEVSKDFLFKLKTGLDNNYGFVYSNYKLIDRINNKDTNMKLKYNTTHDILNNWKGMPSYMWRRELIDEIGFFDESIMGCEDYDFVVKTFVAAQDSILHIDDFLFTYYKRHNTLTTKLFNEIPILTQNVIDKYKHSIYLHQLHQLLFHFQDETYEHKDVFIYVSDVDYYKLFQRPQQFLKLLSKSYICIFVSNITDYFINHNNVWIVNNKLFELYINNFNIRSRNIIMYYNDPKFYFYKNIMHPQSTIFDLIDNPVEEFKVWQQNLKGAVDNADIVIYSSNYLLTVLKNINPDKEYYYISNGCDFTHFNRAQFPIEPKPIELRNIPDKPIIGYYGAITSWLDFELIKKIANMSNIHVVMIGGIKNNKLFNMKFDHKNITWIDHVDYDLIPIYLSWFNICMIPFKQSEMIKGCNPIKFYEYYSSGKIVIGSDFPDITHFYYKINHNNYKTTINNILQNCDIWNPRKDYVDFAKQNSWAKHIDKLLSLIRIDFTIIYPPIVNYNFLMQRPAQLIKCFAKQPGFRAIFFESDFHAPETKTFKFMILNKSTFINRLQYYLRGKLIYYYTYPNNINYKQYLKPFYTIFDLIDNPTDEFHSWNNNNLISSIKESDLFVSSAPIMFDNYKHLNHNSILVSNGCDYSHFAYLPPIVSASSNLTPTPVSPLTTTHIPKILSNKKNKIIIGYYGAHASWVDYDLIKKIADYKPDTFTVVMIGKSDVYNHSIKHNNITWINHVDYNVLPSYLSYFDICMIPFKLTEMIKGCDPIKFYEYCASGKPIITTRIEPILKYNNICFFMDHSNYKNMIDKAYATRNQNISLRQEVALNNSWDNKAGTIIKHLIAKHIHTTILYPPYVSWNKMYQRPQQMITALSHKDGYRCIFIDYTLHDNIIINNSLIIASSYDKAKQYIVGKIVLYYNSPSIVNELPKYKFDINVFELVDNPVDEFDDWKISLNDAFSKANKLSITSPVMTDLLPKNKPFKIIPNGADFFHFNKALHRLKKPNDFPNINSSKKIIGYYGAHASWVDFDLIKKIADLDFVHVVMIGKMKTVYNISFKHSNITWLPIKEYTELPFYLSWFDICMIPFKLTQMIKACDPIKFYEYSSAGKPVIATHMEELYKFKDVVYFINHNNYKTIIKNAINDIDNVNLNHKLIEKRQAIATNNTWSDRADAFIDLIQNHP
jgi:glycosyltransferase involved in cell wall biosynthesis